MPVFSVFDQSDTFAEELMALIAVPLFDNSQRIQTSGVACSLSLEHWKAVRVLLRSGLLSSATVVHRAQFEALARSIWLLYAASENHLSKLTATLSSTSEQAAKNVPQTADMMLDLERRAPHEAYVALNRFKESSWKALNSYAHAGIHPIRRHSDGYPAPLLIDVLCNANGLAVIASMQGSVLSGQKSLQRRVLALAAKHPACMPLPL